MNKLGLLVLAVALVGCGDDDDGGTPAADAAAGTIDSAPGTPDADTTDAAPTADAAPISVLCSALPVDLPGNDLGDYIQYGTICFNPAGKPDPEDCHVTEEFPQNIFTADTCSYGGILVGKFPAGSANPGGDINVAFGFGTQVVAKSGGTMFGNEGVRNIPDGQFSVDFKGGFNTGAASTEVYRAVFSYNANGTVTVTSIGLVP